MFRIWKVRRLANGKLAESCAPTLNTGRNFADIEHLARSMTQAAQAAKIPFRYFVRVDRRVDRIWHRQQFALTLPVQQSNGGGE